MKKKVLILGGSSDIGIEVIKKFLKNKWVVVAHYSKNNHELKKIKNKNLKIFKYDLRDIYYFEIFLNRNSLFNDINSFISLTGYINSANFSKIKIIDFYDHINVNYLSNLIILKKILPKMKKNNFGRVLLSSSTGVKFGGGETTPLYSLTKYMNEFFFSSYNEFFKKNVLINTIRIGLTKTKLHKKIKKNLAKRIQLIPIKRMASTKEVANYIFIYSTEFNTLTTRKIIDVTGGE
tara:strand:+ start:934 stop:1638 length:705 start_codon:yes stop_codon:yes gene_type:complete